MEPIEYEGRLLEDGHLSVPSDIRRRLRLAPKGKVRVILVPVDGAGRGQPSPAAWDDLARLSDAAVGGMPADGAENHDAYLYGPGTR